MPKVGIEVLVTPTACRAVFRVAVVGEVFGSSNALTPRNAE